MKSRIPVGLGLMLVALALSFVPAASVGTQSASALAACDWAQFVADVTVPDGTTFAANAAFTKTWRLKNIGSCTWTTSYALVFDSGTAMGGPTSVNLPSSVAPGQSVDVSVSLTAPGSPGHYIGYWKFMNASGARFGIGAMGNRAWWVEITVGNGSSGVAYDFAANYCSASWFSTAGNLPCPGTDGDPRGFVLKVNNPQLENGTTDSGSGLITNPRNIFNGDIHGKFPAFHVQHGDRFQAIVNCAYGATGCFVSFRLEYQIDGGPIYTFWAFREKYEGLTYRADVDLSSLAGRDVKFILTVLADGPAAGDRALWSNPAIVRLGPPGPPPASGSQFDFGTSTSPVASGYTQVTEATAYSSGGFGWTSTTGLESRNRSAPADDLKRDFVMSSSAARTFRTDIPNGTYAVTVTMGDNDFAHDDMVVKANGAPALGNVDAASGVFTVNTFNVNVSSGNLQLEFSDAGGSDPTWVVNAVTIIPTFGPPPPFGCDRAQFVADVTVPDGTNFAPGSAFLKTWRLKNVGNCTWTPSYLLVFDTGDQMGGPSSSNLPTTVPPGHTVDVSVNLTAPSSGGLYRGYWKFQNPGGTRFGIGAGANKSWWVEIWVSGPTATPSGTVTPPTVTATPPTITPTPADTGERKFDFGTDTSPLAAGYARVTESDGYALGSFGWTYGWNDTSSLHSADRGGPNNRRQDFVYSSDPGTFKVALPDGTYTVTVVMGDQAFAHDNMLVKVGGTTMLGPVNTAAGEFDSNHPFSVTVTGGFLGLQFSDTGGDPNWVVNEVTISPSSPPPTIAPPTTAPTTPAPPPTTERKFDFGTDTSPLAAGYARVTESDGYALGSFGWTYGWNDTSSLHSADRGGPNNRRQDFVYSSDPGTFKVALPDGTYTVTVVMGDQAFAHDNMLVKVGGTTMLGPVNTAAGEFDSNHPFSVTVTGGFLGLQFSDTGGDPNWVVNEITITS